MPIIATALKLALAGCTLAAVDFYLLSIVAGLRFFSRRRPFELEVEPETLEPATIMIPLHGADFKAYENYAGLCRQDYLEYQVVFGVRDPRDSSIPTVQKLIE